MWALIVDGVVREITDIEPAGRFHPLLEWRECGPDVREGWVFDGQDFAPPEAPPTPVPQSITARQLRVGLVLAEWISEAEAVAWRKGESLPAPVQSVIDAMPAAQRFIAEETAFSMSVAERGNPLLLSAAQAVMPDATEQEISDVLDQAFREWSQI